MNAPTLTELFNSRKEGLAEKLHSFYLPRDSKEVQSTVSGFLDNMLEDEGSYRQNLTQSEDYILQAALAMLNAQREMVSAFDVTPQFLVEKSSETSMVSDEEKLSNNKNTNINSTNAFIGVGGGAVIGKIILGGWGAVFGAIAGTAIALYMSQQFQKNISVPKRKLGNTLSSGTPKVELIDTPVNVEVLLSVISQICISLDNLISTFRNQIKRVVNKYESQEKPSIERDFRVLLEGIQSLIGYKRGHSPEEEKYVSKLQTRVEDLADLLDNYDLEAIDYSTDNSVWFDVVESANTMELKQVIPAIIRGGSLVLKGKVFVPKQ